MAIPPRPMASLVDSGIEAPEGMNIDIPQPETFEGGAEVLQSPDGGAMVQALMGGEGIEVQTEQYDHNANLAEVLDEKILDELSSELRGQYEEDLEARSEWKEGYVKGLDLLGINYQERTEPFDGASGVTHPLIAESVTQFQAQSYKELLPSGGPVKINIMGNRTMEREAQAARVREFMNYQITEVMQDYDTDTDQMLFYLPLAGSTFKKIYYDQTMGTAVSKFVPAEDLVVPYQASDINTVSRVTHVLKMDENDIRKMQVAGIYRDVEISSSDDDQDVVQEKKDELEGASKGYSDEIFSVLEMHVNLDIEGFEDLGMDGQPTGIKLPYIVTLDQGSGEILSITRNYEANDPLKKKVQYFVHYKFLPGLGFYGFGLIHMIGGLGRATTSILRQLIDAGTLSNLPAGFKARGIRIRNDDEPLSPGEFRDIDAPGGDLRNSIVPLPFKEPSGTLSNLLAALIEAGRRFVSIADQKIGETSGDMPVGSTVAMLERGMKVMSAIHKRLHYAQKTEFRILARIFAENLPQAYPYEVAGGQQQVYAADFDGRVDVLPVSDPNIFSMAQRVALAQTQLQIAQSNPDIHNLPAAYRRLYQALEVQNIDEILPPKKEPMPMDPSIENARALQGEIVIAFPQQNHDQHMANHILFMKTPIVATSPNVMAILYAHILEHISQKSTNIAQSEVQEAMQLQMLAQQGAIDPANVPPPITPEIVQSRIAELEAQFTADFLQQIAPPQGQEDPLVEIRKQELAIRAAEAQRDAEVDQQKLALEAQKIQQRAVTDAARLETQEEIADDRNTVNRERIQTQRDIAAARRG